MSTDEKTPLNNSKEANGNNESKPNPSEPNYVMFTAIISVLLAVGTGLAFLTLSIDSQKATYRTKILDLEAQDLQWLYLSLVILGRMIALINFVPTGYKSDLKGNIRSNPFFFETSDDDKSMVLFKEDGFHGKYNRSNRSVHHMVENFGAFVASIGPVGYIFPKQTCALVSLFSVGRILHQKGYSKGYGGHAWGFLCSLLATITMDGLALIVFLKASKIIS